MARLGTPSRGRTGRRRGIDRALIALMAASCIAVALLFVFMAVSILARSRGYLNLGFVLGDGDGGILPMVVSTLEVALLSLAVALPIGVMAAVYLHEYAKDGPVVRLARLAVETLAGIPSILYGLFGLLVFCRALGFAQSVAAGAATLSIMILPVIIRTTEEALKTVPVELRQASLSLGATRFQTVLFVVLPGALPGILTAAVLAAGRVVGESAPVLLTVGLSRNVPKSIFDSGRTLTVHLYYLTKEALHEDDFARAFATAGVLLLMMAALNTIARVLAKRARLKA